MSDELAMEMVRFTHSALCVNDHNISGAVFLHGTSTLAETIFLADLLINCHKPVVATGSMRPYTALSYDGIANLYHAVALAVSPDARDRGAMIAFNE